MAVSTFQLTTPTGFDVAKSCRANGASGKSRVSVKVTGSGTAPRATDYVLTVSDESGIRYTTDLKANVTTTYEPNTASTTWTYAIKSEYRVKSTGVTWKSKTEPIKIC
jgi:hypothetical protein